MRYSRLPLAGKSGGEGEHIHATGSTVPLTGTSQVRIPSIVMPRMRMFEHYRRKSRNGEARLPPLANRMRTCHGGAPMQLCSAAADHGAPGVIWRSRSREGYIGFWKRKAGDGDVVGRPNVQDAVSLQLAFHENLPRQSRVSRLRRANIAWCCSMKRKEEEKVRASTCRYVLAPGPCGR